MTEYPAQDWKMNSDRALELYSLYLKQYATTHHVDIVEPPELPYEENAPSNAAHDIVGASRSYLRELSNSINDLRRWINIVSAWKPVYDSCDLEDQIDLLLQHISPIATLALSAPQALRGRIIFAAGTGFSIANDQLYRGNKKLQWDHGQHHTMKGLSKAGSVWSTWPALAEKLGAISTKEWSLATNDFRNEHQHGHPRRIGIGLISIIRIKQVKDVRQVGYGSREPISLQTVINTAIEGHNAVVAAYHALGELMAQQITALYADAKKNNAHSIQGA